MNGFLSRPVVRHHRGGGRCWELVEPLTFRSYSEFEITLPAGFRWDGPSIPRISAALACRYDAAFAPSAVHDAGYRLGRTDADKRAWDLLFWEGLLTEGAEQDDARRTWEGVAALGWGAWNAHRAVDAWRYEEAQ